MDNKQAIFNLINYMNYEHFEIEVIERTTNIVQFADCVMESAKSVQFNF